MPIRSVGTIEFEESIHAPSTASAADGTRKKGTCKFPPRRDHEAGKYSRGRRKESDWSTPEDLPSHSHRFLPDLTRSILGSNRDLTGAETGTAMKCKKLDKRFQGRFGLINVAATRARQLQQGARPKIKTSSVNVAQVALAECLENLIDWDFLVEDTQQPAEVLSKPKLRCNAIC